MTNQELIAELIKIRASYRRQASNPELSQYRKDELMRGIISLNETIKKLAKEA